MAEKRSATAKTSTVFPAARPVRAGTVTSRVGYPGSGLARCKACFPVARRPSSNQLRINALTIQLRRDDVIVSVCRSDNLKAVSTEEPTGALIVSGHKRDHTLVAFVFHGAE